MTRALAFVAALLVGGDLASPGRAHAAASGIEMVLCSGDGVVTITLDREGNPIEGRGAECCDCGCALCPGPGSVLQAAEAATAATGYRAGASAAFALQSLVLTSARGRLPVPRGPPTEKEA